MVGVARKGHPLLRTEPLTAQRYAACRHVVASKRNETFEAIDHELEKLNLTREVRVVVPGFPDAMRIVASSDLIAAVPASCLGKNRTGKEMTAGDLCSFELPIETPEILVSAIWHPRVDADPAHRWLRNVVTEVCRRAYS